MFILKGDKINKNEDLQESAMKGTVSCSIIIIQRVYAWVNENG